jgi:hypothetical protein
MGNNVGRIAGQEQAQETGIHRADPYGQVHEHSSISAALRSPPPTFFAMGWCVPACRLLLLPLVASSRFAGAALPAMAANNKRTAMIEEWILVAFIAVSRIDNEVWSFFPSDSSDNFKSTQLLFKPACN